MVLHRITTKSYIHDLSGTGAMLYGGRWNSKGKRMLYTSGSLSLAALEIIANLSSNKLNQNLFCVELDFPDHLDIQTLEALPEQWNSFPYTHGTVDSGTGFINKGGLCLKVPSALISTEYNYLLNPQHDQFSEIRVMDSRPLIIDQRLIK